MNSECKTAHGEALEHWVYKFTVLTGSSVSISFSHSGVFTGVGFFLLHLAVFVPGCDPVVPDLESAYCCL